MIIGEYKNSHKVEILTFIDMITSPMHRVPVKVIDYIMRSHIF